jgi:hypothetical protein
MQSASDDVEKLRTSFLELINHVDGARMKVIDFERFSELDEWPTEYDKMTPSDHKSCGIVS